VHIGSSPTNLKPTRKAHKITRPARQKENKLTQPKYTDGLGFRDIEIFNLALLTKQAWCILIRPDLLCSQILKAVYFPNDDFLNAAVGSDPSKTWRAICDGIEVLNQGLIKRIGDGRSTHIWSCNWIPRIGMYRPRYSKKPNPPSLVCELIDHTTMSWNTEVLRIFFSEMDIDAIIQIPLSMRRQEDCWAGIMKQMGSLLCDLHIE
jgi:hypothetical protein